MTFREVVLLGKKLKKLSNLELIQLKDDPKLTIKEYEIVQDEILRRIK